jgi:hypothetical protein
VHFEPRNQKLFKLNDSDIPAMHFAIAGFRGRMRIEMRLYFVLAVACALCQTAIAQTPDCKLTADPAARLACYDRSAPPAVPSRTFRPIRALPQSKIDSTGYMDSISAEDALMNERIKGICRGC